MKNKLALAVAVVTLFQSSFVSALRLGDVVVESNVNEPLIATIELGSVDNIPAEQILVQMASSADFRKANIEKPYHLSTISFKVEQGAKGKVLRLSSSQKITEPYLNFILDTRWPNGRVMREYLVLLDLPIHSSAAGGKVQPVAKRNLPAKTTNVSTQAGFSGSSIAARKHPLDTSINGATGNRNNNASEYQVKSNDTLWEIAQNNQIQNASVEQTMHAIFDKNKQAFIDANINQLKKGAILRLPEADQAALVSHADAKQWQRNQRAAWKKVKQQPPEMLQSIDGSAGSKQLTETTKSPKGHLTLTSSEDNKVHDARAEKTLADATGANASETNKPKSSASNAEVVQMLEQLDRKKLEHQALEARYTSLNTRFEQLEKLVALKNAQLAELTASIERSDELLESLESESSGLGNTLASADPAATSATDETVSEEPAEQKAQPEDESLAAAALVGKAAPSPNTPTKVPDGSPPTSTPPPTSTNSQGTSPTAENVSGTVAGAYQSVVAKLPPVIGKNLHWIAAGLFTAVLAAVGLFRMRNKPVEEEGDVDTAFLESLENEESIEESTFGSQGLAPQQWSTDVTDTTAIELEAGAAGEALADNEGDDLAGVDIFLAYGSFERALEALDRLIAEDAQNVDAHLKRVETYCAKGDIDAAQQAADELLGFAPEQEARVNDLLNDQQAPAQEDALANDLQANDENATDLELDISLGAEVQPELATDENFADTLELDTSSSVLDDVAETTEMLDTVDLELDIESEIDVEDELASLAEDIELDDFDVSFSDDAIDASLNSEDQKEEDATGGSGSYRDDIDDVSDIDFANAFSEVEEPSMFTSVESSVDSELTESNNDIDFASQDVNELSGLDGAPKGGSSTVEEDLAAAYGDLAAELVDGEDDFSPELNESDADIEESLALDRDIEASELIETEVKAESAEPVSIVPEALEIQGGSETLSDADLEAEFQSASEMLEQAIDEAESDNAEVGEETSAELAAQEASDSAQLDDEVATKLDLARAYLEMGDVDGAKDVLDEVLSEGSTQQIQEANSMLQKIA